MHLLLERLLDAVPGRPESAFPLRPACRDRDRGASARPGDRARTGRSRLGVLGDRRPAGAAGALPGDRLPDRRRLVAGTAPARRGDEAVPEVRRRAGRGPDPELRESQRRLDRDRAHVRRAAARLLQSCVPADGAAPQPDQRAVLARRPAHALPAPGPAEALRGVHQFRPDDPAQHRLLHPRLLRRSGARRHPPRAGRAMGPDGPALPDPGRRGTVPGGRLHDLLDLPLARADHPLPGLHGRHAPVRDRHDHPRSDLGCAGRRARLRRHDRAPVADRHPLPPPGPSRSRSTTGRRSRWTSGPPTPSSRSASR